MSGTSATSSIAFCPWTTTNASAAPVVAITTPRTTAVVDDRQTRKP